jgi:hypothetical protein
VINKFNRKNLPPYFELKVVTVQEIIDAIRKNGFDHLRSSWVHESFDRTIDGGCVLGQGAINVGAASHDDVVDDLVYGFFRTREHYDQYNESELIGYLKKFTLASQLDKVPANRQNEWVAKFVKINGISDRRIGCAEVIIFWNDERVEMDKYVLKTYQEVADMAASVLKPHSRKSLSLLSHTWKVPANIETKLVNA